MAKIFNTSNNEFVRNEREVPEYCWSSIPNISEKIKSKNLKFNIRILDSGQYSFPYHSHRNAEEMHIILEGEAMLRTPEGIQKVNSGDVIYFEMGPEGAHQLKNSSTEPCRYVDIWTDLGMDVCDYPDSGKVNILPDVEIYEKENQVDYFHGEKNIKDIW
jgi:uncharacterized cupin superfamily protein